MSSIGPSEFPGFCSAAWDGGWDGAEESAKGSKYESNYSFLGASEGGP